MTAIITLNWNGWKDTIACLDSLQRCEGNFRIVIVDNGSTDDSINEIEKYLSQTSQTHKYELIRLEENYGFARGNNEAIRRMSHIEEIDHILLLNNDTIVEADFLTKLETYHLQHLEYKVLTPLICYYDSPTKIWNAGGWQHFGFRKYYYADQNISILPSKQSCDISFVTGCALWFDKSLLDSSKGILTERFFFGEEDFEFCLRMNQQKVKMACVLNSKIYHKVSSSTKSTNTYGKIYLHYLNRFVDMRLHFSSPAYAIWTIPSVVYTALILLRIGWNVKDIYLMLSQVIHEASYKTSISKDDFSHILNKDKSTF